MVNTTSFQQEEDRSWIQVDPGVERMIMGYNRDLMMVKVRFQKNAVGALHSHKHVQSTYIAEGVFEVIIGEQNSFISEYP